MTAIRDVHVLTAAAVYFGIAFAAGFLLGVVRVGLLVPRIGEGAAVVCELPVMLAISWAACRCVIARWRIPAAHAPRLIMGLSAFILLMLAEFLLSLLVMGRGPAGYLVQLTEPARLAGLAAQVVYAAFPWLQRRL